MTVLPEDATSAVTAEPTGAPSSPPIFVGKLVPVGP